jgi:hypothetical protein
MDALGRLVLNQDLLLLLLLLLTLISWDLKPLTENFKERALTNVQIEHHINSGKSLGATTPTVRGKVSLGSPSRLRPRFPEWNELLLLLIRCKLRFQAIEVMMSGRCRTLETVRILAEGRLPHWPRCLNRLPHQVLLDYLPVIFDAIDNEIP